jgi:DNA-binding CsgD family transcriptional regulator
MGQLEEAEAIYQTALAEARADDFPMTYGLALCGLARIAHGRADHARARALYEEGLSELLEVGGMPQVALTHAALGWLALEEGDAQRARGCFAQSLELATRLGHHEALVAALEGVAALLARGRSGRDALPRQAEQSLTLRLLGAAQRLRAQGHLPAAGQPVGRVLAAATRSAGEPRARRLLAEGGALAPDEAGRLARSALESCERSRLEPALTPREHEVAVLLARGCSNREIAQALVVGLRTAEMHVGNLLGKLGLSSRSQIAAWAVQHGLLDTVP